MVEVVHMQNPDPTRPLCYVLEFDRVRGFYVKMARASALDKLARLVRPMESHVVFAPDAAAIAREFAKDGLGPFTIEAL